MSVQTLLQDPSGLDVDAEIGSRLVEVKLGVSASRSIRLGMMKLAHALAQRHYSDGFLVISASALTKERLLEEWEYANAILRPETLSRITLCIEDRGQIDGIPRIPDAEAQHVLLQVLEEVRARTARRITRTDASFVILKILLHQWLTAGNFVTADWLARTSGYTYPTVANVVKGLGSLIERRSDRRFRLRWFPQEEFGLLVATSNRARATSRYSERSGQPRPLEAHLARLERINPSAIGIGGVLGAKHYFPGLDIVGTPRLDISIDVRNPEIDLDFIDKLDPALVRIQDPLEPASIVVHHIYHEDPLFVPREGGLQWADPVECLLDLYEARLETQAAQFLDALRKERPLNR